MNTINQTIQSISEAVRLEYFIKVDDSTGSYHDKTDVKNLIVRIVDEMKTQLIREIEENNLLQENRNIHLAIDERLYTKEMIDKAWKEVDIDEHVEVDLDSAEFSIGYSNRLELDSANVEINYDDITEDFTSALDKAYNETYSINNTNN